MNSPDTTASATPASGNTWWQASGWLHLVWRASHYSVLLGLVNLVFQPFFDPAAGAADWLLAAGIAVIVVVLYVLPEPRTVPRDEHARRWFTVPVTLLGLAATPFNMGAGVLFVYAAGAAGASETRRNALRWFVGLTALWSVYGAALMALSRIPLPWGLWSYVPPLLFIWVVGLWVMESAEQEQAAADLRIHNARVGHLATMAERERIARDLHDLLGHTLTSVVVRAQLIQQLTATDASRAGKEAAEIERTAREALSEVRGAVSGWREASLDTELESARETLAAARVELTVRRNPDLELVGPAEHELALALREAVTNVARHARARTCRVDLDAHGGELRLLIADDGVGGNTREGGGLTGMRERITALGGHVQRAGSAGTTLTVAVPLEVAT